MKVYIVNFLKSRGLPVSDSPPALMCEWCFERPMDNIHHIILKGMGGSKKLDYAENLIGLCLTCHKAAHGLVRPTLEASELEDRVKLILETIKGDKL